MDKLDLILSKLDKVDDRLSKVENRLDKLEEKIDKLEALTLDVHKIYGMMTSFKESQDRQDKILEALALRSLEQETDIRELKRIS